ncbi:ARPP-1 family domain-containing protein [Geodermatophilus sp. SYSU D00758]
MTDIGVRLHVGQGTHRGPLAVFPVWTDAPPSPTGYLTGAAAPVEVAERAGSPAVDQLVVTNRAHRPVLLLAGELLEGGMQHRALTATTLLPPDRPTVLPVVCVEQGRWHGSTVHRRQARRVPLGVLPRLHSQAEVWRRVHRYEAVAGPSATDSLAERLDRSALRTQELVGGLRPLEGQRGLLIGVAGRPAWLELFDSARTLRAHWSGLMQAAALDAVGRPELRTPATLARGLAERVERTRLDPDGPAGLGRRLCGGGRVRTDAVSWRERTVHLTAVDLTHPLQEA